MTKNIPLDHNASLSTDFGAFRQSTLIGWALAYLMNITDVYSPSSAPIFACWCVFAVQCTRVPPLTSRKMNGCAGEEVCVRVIIRVTVWVLWSYLKRKKKKVCVVVPYIDWAMQYFFSFLDTFCTMAYSQSTNQITTVYITSYTIIWIIMAMMHSLNLMKNCLNDWNDDAYTAHPHTDLARLSFWVLLRIEGRSRNKRRLGRWRSTHQHDNTPVEDPPVVAVATGRAQQGLLHDVTAAGVKTQHGSPFYRSLG
jgi:hypothetical protein